MISYHIALAALQCDAVEVAAASVFDAALECTMCWGAPPRGCGTWYGPVRSDRCDRFS